MKKTNKLSKILYIIILIIMVTPLLYFLLGLPDISKLKGDIKNINEPKFSWESWFAEDYQKKQETYYNQKFGFRSTFVRINNQIAYSLFRKAKANGVIIGKKSYLYETSYIRAYFGKDFVGEEIIDDKIFKIKALQDTLKKLNKDLIVVFAAGKASFYPEYIPDSFITEKTISNYDYYIKRIKEENINHIDFNLWFRQMKDTATYLLYPKTGIHWTKYGMLLVSDSLIKYIEDMRNIDMPDLSWSDIIMAKDFPGSDRDIEKGMNLLFRIPNNLMAYPQNIQFDEKNKTKPKVIVFADSFYWGLFNLGLSEKAFDKGQFWFYNKQVFIENFKNKHDASNMNYKDIMLKQDVFILMATDATLHKFAFGAIDNLYDFFVLGKSPLNTYDKEFWEKVKIKEQVIRNSKKWVNSLKKDAKEENITLDSMIRRHAIYIVKKKLNEKK